MRISAIFDEATSVMDAWFNAMLDMGMDIPAALDFIESSYPEGQAPMDDQVKWDLFKKHQLDQTKFVDFRSNKFTLSKKA